ncbi:hypothetical protein R3P38DRAFT_3367068 [Favolaschia claudopus]|uniref:Uncharacterized protein n=1 Tax=Favolaschia claudopus TaxID=2862362 RepID=A0AAW0ABV6_9AGAR
MINATVTVLALVQPLGASATLRTIPQRMHSPLIHRDTPRTALTPAFTPAAPHRIQQHLAADTILMIYIPFQITGFNLVSGSMASPRPHRHVRCVRRHRSSYLAATMPCFSLWIDIKVRTSRSPPNRTSLSFIALFMRCYPSSFPDLRKNPREESTRRSSALAFSLVRLIVAGVIISPPTSALICRIFSEVLQVNRDTQAMSTSTLSAHYPTTLQNNRACRHRSLAPHIQLVLRQSTTHRTTPQPQYFSHQIPYFSALFPDVSATRPLEAAESADSAANSDARLISSGSRRMKVTICYKFVLATPSLELTHIPPTLLDADYNICIFELLIFMINLQFNSGAVDSDLCKPPHPWMHTTQAGTGVSQQSVIAGEHSSSSLEHFIPRRISAFADPRKM